MEGGFRHSMTWARADSLRGKRHVLPRREGEAASASLLPKPEAEAGHTHSTGARAMGLGFLQGAEGPRGQGAEGQGAEQGWQCLGCGVISVLPRAKAAGPNPPLHPHHLTPPLPSASSSTPRWTGGIPMPFK